MDGVLIDLLNAKWNTFVKKKFYKQFFTFAFYFLITLVCFTLRPGPPTKTQAAAPANNTNSSLLRVNVTDAANSSTVANETLKLSTTVSPNANTTDDDDEDNDMEEWWDNLTDECRLMKLDTPLDQIRLAAEVFMLLGAFTYLAAAVREARFLGGRMFFENLVRLVGVVVFCVNCGKRCR